MATSESDVFNFNITSSSVDTNGKMSLKDFRRFIKIQSDLIDNGGNDIPSDGTNETDDLNIRLKAADAVLNMVNFPNDWDGNSVFDKASKSLDDAKGKLMMKQHHKDEFEKWKRLGNNLPGVVGLDEKDGKCHGCNEKNCNCNERKDKNINNNDLNVVKSNLKNHKNVISNDDNQLYCFHCDKFVDEDRYNNFGDACFDCLERVFCENDNVDSGDHELPFDFDLD